VARQEVEAPKRALDGMEPAVTTSSPRVVLAEGRPPHSESSYIVRLTIPRSCSWSGQQHRASPW
jgi:hypothetical protein